MKVKILQWLRSVGILLKVLGRALEYRQRYGPTIGDRKTPVFSVWPVDLKSRWKKGYWFWQGMGTDGDMMMTKNGLYIPVAMNLTYIRFRKSVFQIATIQHRAHYSGAYPKQPDFSMD